MKTNERIEMLKNIEQHGANLNAIFNTVFDNKALCSKLFHLENKANRAATCLCNTNTLNYLELPRGYSIKEATEVEVEKFFNDILKKVYKILGEKAKDIVFINYDPRGYTLKIRDSYIKENNIKIFTDWGGYGILAPDFTPIN